MLLDGRVLFVFSKLKSRRSYDEVSASEAAVLWVDSFQCAPSQNPLARCLRIVYIYGKYTFLEMFSVSFLLPTIKSDPPG